MALFLFMFYVFVYFIYKRRKIGLFKPACLKPSGFVVGGSYYQGGFLFAKGFASNDCNIIYRYY